MKACVVGLALLAACARGRDRDEDLLLARVAVVDHWFRRGEHTSRRPTRATDGASGPDTPSAWTVRSERDVAGPRVKIYTGAKRVYRAHASNVSVVVKGASGRGARRTTNRGGSLLYFELV